MSEQTVWPTRTVGRYPASNRKEALTQAAMGTHLEDITLREISRSQKDKYSKMTYIGQSGS